MKYDKKQWMIFLIFISAIVVFSSCERTSKHNQISEDFNIHILHLNMTRFEDRLIGFLYAQEKLLEAGNNAIPNLIKDMGKRDALLIHEINGLLRKMPRSKETQRLYEATEQYAADLRKRYSKYDGNPEKSKELIFDKTVHWYHRSETAFQLIHKGEFPSTDLIPFLKSGDLDDRKAAITTLNKIAFMEHGRRLIMTKTESKNLEALQNISEQDRRILTPLLINLLNSQDLDIGRRSALVLGWFGDPSIVPTLIKKISLVNPYVQEGITVALAELKDPQAVEPLHELLQNGQTPYVRASAAQALENFHIHIQKKYLFKALADKEWLVRSTAAIVLTSYKEIETIGPFIKLLSDENSYVRREGLFALGKFGNNSLKDTVSKCFNDPDPEVRQTAEEVIYKFEHGKWPPVED